MSIEALKQQARKHEQKEDWSKALDQYNKALAELARDEQVDIGLYNRVGDLQVRVGSLEKAVEHYERAVALYQEAYLPNNAIAVCKKIIRNVPAHHRAYLQIGQIRAEQGFLSDARTHFLTYAERMQQAGDLDESFRALIEFCDLAPDDVGVRITVADQIAASGRSEEAVEQLLVAHRHLSQVGETGQAQEVETKILAIDPEADLTALPAMGGFGGSSVGDDGEVVADFGEISIGAGAFGESDADAAPDDLAVADATEEATADSPEAEFEVQAEFVGTEVSSDAAGGQDAVTDDDDEEEAVALPMMDFEEEGAEEAVELPTMDFGEESAEEAVELPTMDFEVEGAEEAVESPTMDVGEESAEEAVELPTFDFGGDETAEGDAEGQVDAVADVGDGDAEEEAADLPTVDFATESDEEEAVELPMMEIDGEETEFAVDAAGADEVEDVAGDVSADGSVTAVEEEDDGAPMEVITPEESTPDLEEEPSAEAAEATQAVEDVPAADEPPDEGYVDLGAMILGGTKEKSTRFTVAYEEPSGDEDADFAKMLSQFKEKVSENLDSSDVRAHYDLGTAYKEMGLHDEAISSFQTALRASPDHLPTYELMGQTFIEMGQHEAAVKSLERALESDSGVEDDLIGIYYYLGRAYEALENSDSAVEFYDRVFSLDINFADVTERLRELR